MVGISPTNVGLWAFGPIPNASVGRDDLGEHFKTFYFITFFLKLHILATGSEKVKIFDQFQPFCKTK